MHFQRLREELMKSKKIKVSITAVAVASLISGLALVGTAAAATETCTTGTVAGITVSTNAKFKVENVETCDGKLANGAAYRTLKPANFGGTMFYYVHGFRPSFPYPGYTPPTGVEEVSPYSANTKSDITAQMLKAGYGIATWDRVSANGMHGWNVDDSITMLKELVQKTDAKYSDVKKNVVYGSSGGGPIIEKFAESNPSLVNSMGTMAGLTAVGDSLQSACDLFYILSVFADPTIKGCAAFGVSKGVAGHMAALGELSKAGALLSAWSKNLGSPELAYPAPLVGSGIPQRSALLLAGLLVGLPTKSAHMDGISTSAVVPEQSINATIAVLENTLEALATGTLAGQAVGELTGPGFYDNTKTDYSALLSEEDAGRYNLGLSGDNAIAAMLGVLKAAPRVKGDPAAVAKMAVQDKVTYKTSVPAVLLSNEADRLVFVGNTVQYIDRRTAVYEAELAKYEAQLATGHVTMKRPTLGAVALYALTPETYTKFTSTGLPDLAGPKAVSGIDHQSFTQEQMFTWVRLLAIAAKNGQVPSAGTIARYSAATPYLNTDPDFRPAELKHNEW
jgi:hypothetical protein